MAERSAEPALAAASSNTFGFGFRVEGLRLRVLGSRGVSPPMRILSKALLLLHSPKFLRGRCWHGSTTHDPALQVVGLLSGTASDSVRMEAISSPNACPILCTFLPKASKHNGGNTQLHQPRVQV